MELLGSLRFPVVAALPTASASAGRVYEKDAALWFSTGTAWLQLSFAATTLAGYGITDAVAASAFTWTNLGSKPTTLSGFGITDAIAASQKGVADGVASLGSDGKVPSTQLPTSMVGQVAYQGTWDATSGAPTASPQKGWYYVVTVAGSTNLSGITDWKVGDWAIYNGTAWDKVDNTDAIASWNGRTGAVMPAANDYTFAQIGSKPTTLSGFGITDGLQKVTSDAAAAANSITENGYFQSLNDPNLPTTGWYWIHSFRHTNAGYGFQFMHHHTTEDWYVRRQVAGTWQPAVELWHSGNFDAQNFASGMNVGGGHASLSANFHSLVVGDRPQGDGKAGLLLNPNATADDGMGLLYDSTVDLLKFLDWGTAGAPTRATIDRATGNINTGGSYGPQIGMLAGITTYGYLWPASLTPAATNYALAVGVTGTYTYLSAQSLVRLCYQGTPQLDIGNGTVARKNANSTTMTAQPRVFVQSADPGAAAADGDLWIW